MPECKFERDCPDACPNVPWNHHFMSRFFDALKEASRSRSTAERERRSARNWEALVPDGNELLNEAIASAAATRSRFGAGTGAAANRLARPELTERFVA